MITNEEIEAAKTPAGGWTKETLAGWGIPWPPQKGWRAKLLKSKDETPASQIERLKTALEFAGEMGRLCVKPDTKRRCPYCDCGEPKP